MLAGHARAPAYGCRNLAALIGFLYLFYFNLHFILQVL